MNGYYDEYDDVALEDFEYDDAFPEFFEDDGELDIERRGRRGRSSRRAAPRGARGGGYNQPRSSSQNVTPTQLHAVTMRIGNDIKKLNEADKTLNTRINASNARLDSHAAAIKKEIAARKKAIAAQQTALVLTAAAALFLTPKTTKVKDSSGKDVEVVLKEDNFLKSLVPLGLALFGGQLGGMLGGLQGGGSSASSGSSSL